MSFNVYASDCSSYKRTMASKKKNGRKYSHSRREFAQSNNWSDYSTGSTPYYSDDFEVNVNHDQGFHPNPPPTMSPSIEIQERSANIVLHELSSDTSDAEEQQRMGGKKCGDGEEGIHFLPILNFVIYNFW